MAKQEASKLKKNGRMHRATYARDKKNGGYLVRVSGPQANMFAGRTVPVEQMSGTEHMEQLDRLIWAGQDDGEISKDPGPCALYSFKPKPKEKVELEF